MEKLRKLLRRSTQVVVAVACVVASCSGVRHPLDDSETRPDTEVLAVEEAETTMDQIGDSTMEGESYIEDAWVAETGCATAPFAPSQGEVGSVLIRTYSVTDLSSVGTADQLLDEYEAYWAEGGESVSRSSPSMEPGAVARVNGVGYELVSVPPNIELRAFIPCY